VKKGGKGGAKTSQAGSDFEDQTYEVLLNDLKHIGYSVKSINRGAKNPRHLTLDGPGTKVIEIFFKASLHKDFFEPRGIKSSDYFSARLEPDTAIFSNATKTLTIIEKKQQTGTGSVAEKLQTCDYKMIYYKTLCDPIGLKVDLVWQLGEYFKKQEIQLRSVFEYMNPKGSTYYFHKIPVGMLKI
jgi:hypothetical protein